MSTLTLFDVKTHLSRIVEELVEGKEDQVVISRRGKPVVRMIPVRKADTSKRIGLARGRFKVPDNIDGANETIASLFAGQRKQA
jgi:prevent-host-death family protein